MYTKPVKIELLNETICRNKYTI